MEKKTGYVIIGVVIMMLAGLLLAWSLFVTPLEAEFSWDRSQTSLIFTISIISFSIGGVVSGAIRNKVSSRGMLFLSGVLICVGFFLSAQVRELMQLYVFYGIMCGFGIGLIYNNVVAMVTSWFPQQIGKISGILLMGYGSGAFFFGALVTALIDGLGWRMAFRVIAIIFVVAVSFAALVLREDKRGFAQADTGQDTVRSYRPLEMLRTVQFAKIYLWSFLTASIGFTVISNVAPCAIYYGASTWLSAAAVGCVSIANGAGRIVMGMLLDRLGKTRSIRIIYCMMIAGVILLTAGSMLSLLPMLFAGFFAAVFAYSGLGPANPVIARDLYGSRYYAVNFSLFTTNGVPGSILGSYGMGLVLTETGSYTACFLCCAVIGILVALPGESVARAMRKNG